MTSWAPPRPPPFASSTTVVDRRVVGDPAHQQDLGEPQAQRVPHRRVKRRGGAAGERVDHMVERPGALHGAVGERHRQATVARVELGGLGVQGAVRVRALREHAGDDAERDHSRGGDGHQWVRPRT